MFPVLSILPQLRNTLQSSKIVILQAPPGAGKSTILPLELLDEPWLAGKKIMMLEPRRLAARSVAQRMSDLKETKIGGTIGYRVRFDTNISKETKIEVITEGILTRMIQSDNSLEEVGLLIFDEFHERSLQSDLALALSLQMQNVLRDDLRILIMSATLDGAQLSGLLGHAPVITSTGKQFPVKINYLNIDSDNHISVKMLQAIRKALREEKGDILAFLPGAGEIRRTQQLLEEESVGAIIYPLFGDLPFKQQQEAILPATNGQRKIVLATSIAETSLTIEGIGVVIDSGVSRVSRFDPRSGLTRLETVRVTNDAADQRTGRAGRLGPGVCYRLWTEAIQRNLLPHRKPEILEADLASLLLELSQWGVKDVKELTWITPPPPGSVNQAKELLIQLDALDENGITSRGKEMLQLPTHPRISHMLLKAISKKEKSIACDIAALLEERDPLAKEAGADISLRIETLRKWRSGERGNADKNILERIEKLATNWRKMLSVAVDTTAPGGYEVGRLVVAAYPERLARQQSKQSNYYTLANGRVAKLPDHDPLVHESWLCATQLDAGQKEGKIFLAAAVSEEDLMVMATESEVIRWDDERGMIASALEKKVGTLLLQSKPVSKFNEEKKNVVLLSVIREKGLKMLGWNEECNTLCARIQSLKIWRPDDAWPDTSEHHLLNTLETWLEPYLVSIYKQSELQKLDLITIINGLIPWNLQSRLEVLVPSRMPVPSGSLIPLQYFPDGRSPVMEVRLQEMFGQLETPVVNEGRIKILLHLLSPGYKPVQVTQDLKSFWQTTYHDVRKELRMRYPKHSWPEDAFTAVAIRGAKKRI
ncbi:MAG: ATP-dependent helicase HrpB [Cyclobacteriaceae bacterium]|nr:ATP-dependent helicase HrpB [Cyclobacteriaceae bacterium]